MHEKIQTRKIINTRTPDQELLEYLMPKRIVGLAGGEYEAAICDLLPANKDRSTLVHALINAYGLDTHCESITVRQATKEDLTKFHDSSYVNYVLRKRPHVDAELPAKQKELLKKYNLVSISDDNKDDDDSDDSDQESDSNDTLLSYGLLYDCPLFPYMSKYVTTVAGASISAAKYLTKPNNDEDEGIQRISINWNGGRHHSKKAKASGFCYVNDIVLAILELRKKFEKVMYIDLDLHHGDGVETAFKFSDKVLTFSIHRKDIGFYPGTGDIEEKGKGKGLNYSVNIPTGHGLSDDSLGRIVEEALLPTIEKFDPDAIVVQCGVDGLNSDEHQEWNLTIKGFGEQIKRVLDVGTPTLLLGGGGYEHKQVARCWTYLTSIALDQDIMFDLIPEHSHSDIYEDENFEFWNIQPKNMVDENIRSGHLTKLINAMKQRLDSW